MLVENDKPAAGSNLPIRVIERRLACENTKFFIYFDRLADRSGAEGYRLRVLLRRPSVVPRL